MGMRILKVNKRCTWRIVLFHSHVIRTYLCSAAHGTPLQAYMQVVTSMQPQRNGKIVVDVIKKRRKKPCGGAVDLSISTLRDADALLSAACTGHRSQQNEGEAL
jgi:hypothetical protein